MLKETTKDDGFKQAIAATINPFIGKKEMAKLRACSERTLARWVKEKRFPAPEPIGVRKVGWRISIANLPFAELERIAKEQAGLVANVDEPARTGQVAGDQAGGRLMAGETLHRPPMQVGAA